MHLKIVIIIIEVGYVLFSKTLLMPSKAAIYSGLNNN
jgi:hypothetical protein